MTADDAAEPGGVRARLQAQVDTAPWGWIAPHFARGVVVVTSRDVVDVGVALSRDDTATVSGWLADGTLRNATDDDAAAWCRRDPGFDVVVVAPFVVVRPRS